MLKIFICPECYNIRMVSKQPNAICLHCNKTLLKCDIEYSRYTRLSEEEREDFKEKWKEAHKLNETPHESF